MKQEDKELLLKDICARLPYKLVCKVKYRENGEYKTSNMVLDGIFRDNAYFISQNGTVYSGDYKPYLFPVSNMTEEQKKELRTFDSLDAESTMSLGEWAIQLVDFYNKYHLDYRDLIPMDLALDATDLNIY